MAVALLVGWTLLVWGGRLRNIAESDDSVGSYLIPAVLLVLAGWALLDRRRRSLAARTLAAATAAVWLVRLPLVLLRDHSAGFKVVHAVLALISLVLAYVVSTGRSSVPTVGADFSRPPRSS